MTFIDQNVYFFRHLFLSNNENQQFKYMYSFSYFIKLYKAMIIRLLGS